MVLTIREATKLQADYAGMPISLLLFVLCVTVVVMNVIAGSITGSRLGELRIPLRKIGVCGAVAALGFAANYVDILSVKLAPKPRVGNGNKVNASGLGSTGSCIHSA